MSGEHVITDVDPAPDLRSRTIRGTKVTIIGYGGSQALRFLSNLILSRLLFPGAFGLMGPVITVMNGLEMISDVGVLPSIIQHARGDDRRFLDTAWTVQVIRGFVLAILGSLLAVPAAYWFEKPELTLLIPATCATAAVRGMESTKLASLNRHIALGRIVMVDLCAQLAALFAMVTFALSYRSVWALVLGANVAAVVRLALSHLAIPGPRNRFAMDKEALAELLSFGRWVFLSTLIAFAALNLDMLILGKLLTADVLGVYRQATIVTSVPMQTSGQLAGWVVLPALAISFRQNREAFAAAFGRARRVILPVGVLLMLGAALLAPAVFTFVYDERYRAAGWITQLVIISVWFVYIQDAPVRALLAMGHPAGLWVANGAKLLVSAGASVVGYHLYGLPGFVLGVGAGAAASQLVVVATLKKHGLSIGLEDLRYTLLTLALGATGAMAPRLLAGPLGISAAILSIPIALIILVPVALWALGHVRREMAAR